jgi:hypothetical protein
MAIDADIVAMSKTQLQKELKALKASGLKVNVSGNVPDLKQRLQDARDNKDSGSPAAVSMIGSASGPSLSATVPGCGVSELLPQHIVLHPITVECLKKLHDEFDDEKYTVLDDEQKTQVSSLTYSRCSILICV